VERGRKLRRHRSQLALPGTIAGDMRLGLIGFGAIGQQIALGLSPADGELVGIVVRHADRPRPAAPAPLLADLEALLLHRPELIIEAAGPEAFAEYAEAIVSRGISLISVSASALLDNGLRARLENACALNSSRVYFASGALGGLDALGSAARGGLDTATLRVVEPADEPAALFSGDAFEGIARFPQRLNFAGLAARLADRPLQLEFSRAPGERRLALCARGPFGDFSVTVQPRPRADALSHIVALSVLATLRNRTKPIAIA